MPIPGWRWESSVEMKGNADRQLFIGTFASYTKKIIIVAH